MHGVGGIVDTLAADKKDLQQVDTVRCALTAATAELLDTDVDALPCACGLAHTRAFDGSERATRLAQRLADKLAQQVADRRFKFCIRAADALARCQVSSAAHPGIVACGRISTRPACRSQQFTYSDACTTT